MGTGRGEGVSQPSSGLLSSLELLQKFRAPSMAASVTQIQPLTHRRPFLAVKVGP